MHTRVRPADFVGYGKPDEEYGGFISQVSYCRTQQTVQAGALELAGFPEFAPKLPEFAREAGRVRRCS